MDLISVLFVQNIRAGNGNVCAVLKKQMITPTNFNVNIHMKKVWVPF